MAKTLLSIGIIFKNEIRCLERCVSSLAPLRKAIPCELIMADTGSDDGSREIAERYADIFFDFPWVNDFSAARNALIDRASGRWFLTMDADEWLVPNIKELVNALKSGDKTNTESYSLIVRNFTTYDGKQADSYSDFSAVRILRMSTGIRYQGAIHESWKLPDRPIRTLKLPNTILNHDGYVGLNDDRGKDKRMRNMALLRKKLEDNPEDMMTLLQCIESSQPDPDNIDYIRRGVEAFRNKARLWDSIGGPVMRYAVFAALNLRLPELDEWVSLMRERLPDSFYTNIDVGYLQFGLKWAEGKVSEAVEYGDRCLNAMMDYHHGRGDLSAVSYSTLTYGAPTWEQSLRLPLASAHFQNGDPEGAYKILDKLNFSMMSTEQVRNCVRALREMQIGSEIDLSDLLSRFYQGIGRFNPDKETAEGRLRAFSEEALRFFTWEYLEQEQAEQRVRPAYTLFLPLAGKCVPGTAAAMMSWKKAAAINRLLKNMEDLSQLPQPALHNALAVGAKVPLPSTMEEMDELAEKMARPGDLSLLEGALSRMDESLPQLTWARSVVIASVFACGWKDAEQGMALARGFARVEKAFLERCYTPELLDPENIGILPPVHRFGHFCARAFEALDGGDLTAYTRLLKAGLEAYPGGRAMVDFLSKNTPDLQRQMPSEELLELAERVRMLLSAYSPDDPAAAALKATPVYRRVEHLIEGARI